MAPQALATALAPLLLALDAGTSSVRAIAFDRHGVGLPASEEQLPYAIDTGSDGRADFPAPTLFDLTVQAIDGAVARLGPRAADVAVVGITSFWHGLLGLDPHGDPATPVYYWADRRSAPQAAALRTELDRDAVLQRTGCRLHSSYWPAKLRWLRQTEPDRFAATAKWVSFAEYALARLCGPGESLVTACMASGTGLLDVHRLAWDAEMLNVSGIDPDQLSRLTDLGPSTRALPEFARRWPALASAEWFPALGDGACANVGSGAIGPARIALTVGTSGAMRLILPRPAGAAWPVPSGLWAYRLDRQRAVLGGALSNGGNLAGWISELTGGAKDERSMANAAALAPDSTGLTILPFVAGERSPGWHDEATGVIAGLTLSTRPEHLVRAALEAVAYRFASVYDALAALATPEHQIVASGGALLANPAWLQIMADTLGHDVIALAAGDETTARGAALMAGATAGIVPDIDLAPDVAAGITRFEPDPEGHARYQSGRARQAELEKTLYFAG